MMSLPINTQDEISGQIAALMQKIDKPGLGMEELMKDTPKTFLGGKLGSRYTHEQWRDLVDHYPILALRLWSDYSLRDPRSHGTFGMLRDESATDIIVEKLVRNPRLLPGIVGVWGELLSVSGRKDEIRRAMIEGAAGPIEDYYGAVSRSYSFALALPEEAELLPHIATLLARGSDADLRLRLKEIEAAVSVFCPDLAALRRIANDDRSSSRVRAASVLLSLAHPKNRHRKKDYKRLVSVTCADVGDWYYVALRELLTLLVEENDADARGLLGQLLDRARGEFYESSQIEWILAIWRETSSAPVHRGEFESKWLAGMR